MAVAEILKKKKNKLQKSVTYISHPADCDDSFLLGKSVLVVKNKPSAWNE